MKVGVNAKTTPMFSQPRNRYPLYRRVGLLEDRSGTMRKSPPRQGFDLWTVQPVASPCTSWAIPAHLQMSIHVQIRFLFFNTIFNLGFLYLFRTAKNRLYITHGVELKNFFLVFLIFFNVKVFQIMLYVLILSIYTKIFDELRFLANLILMPHLYFSLPSIFHYMYIQ
jgi:hypothetical protein